MGDNYFNMSLKLGGNFVTWNSITYMITAQLLKCIYNYLNKNAKYSYNYC